jgi:hypothetical protein
MAIPYEIACEMLTASIILKACQCSVVNPNGKTVLDVHSKKDLVLAAYYNARNIIYIARKDAILRNVFHDMSDTDIINSYIVYMNYPDQ